MSIILSEKSLNREQKSIIHVAGYNKYRYRDINHTFKVHVSLQLVCLLSYLLTDTSHQWQYHNYTLDIPFSAL